MPEDLSIPSNIDIQQLIKTYVLPWGINIIMALAIFLIGKFIVKILVSVSKKLMLKAKVDAEGISIPYPQMDVHQDKAA